MNPLPLTFFYLFIFKQYLDIKGALEDFNLSVLINPASPEVYFNRANLFQKIGNYDEADKDYSAVLALSPTDSVSYQERGQT
jgi:tetratricopeptide (TPR) repeat protein